MTAVPHLDHLAPNLVLWHHYDPSVKADLFSTGILVPQGYFLIDPIPLTGAALDDLEQISPISGIVVTNSNHHRASAQFAARFSIPIFAHPKSFPTGQPFQVTEVADGAQLCDGLSVIALDGAAPGEIALHHGANNGTLIVGDALINFEPYGFTFLPAKYCLNAREMKQSLRKLLGRRFERILFGHGMPILSGGSARLQRLLDVDPESAK